MGNTRVNKVENTFGDLRRELNVLQVVSCKKYVYGVHVTMVQGPELSTNATVTW